MNDETKRDDHLASGIQSEMGLGRRSSEAPAAPSQEPSLSRGRTGSPSPPLRRTSRGDIVGRSRCLLEALRVIDRIAPSNCTVLVTGESGTGKESLVGAIHDGSARASGPLVAVNCGAIPAALAEAELFGHARGAFTGAQAERKGFVAAAEGGTLFLDEVGELPLSVQVKLLRLLQQREYVPVGETKAVRCDLRIVAATNRDLEDEIAKGRFRQDLFYRLNVVSLHVPSLRERASDIPLLAEHFARRAQAQAGRHGSIGFSGEALRALIMHNWPGNIRALENAVERAVWLAQGEEIEEWDLFPPISNTSLRAFEEEEIPTRRDLLALSKPSESPAGPPGISQFPAVLPEQGIDVLEATERYKNHMIQQALSRTGGNKNRAAQLLKLNRTTLSDMIRRRARGT